MCALGIKRRLVMLLFKLHGAEHLTAECDCNEVGSSSSVCDPTTGQCECKDHVTGRSCDRCEYNYINFSADGCTGRQLALLDSYTADEQSGNDWSDNVIVRVCRLAFPHDN